ncbi:MAG: ubiquinone/menaquinone biosynthesis methyltransferase [Gemmatimonadetes bacterium]|nr:ubiquinone/menaquinone biosynthesis methyltransferase [Gemmatimonadota bacterium]
MVRLRDLDLARHLADPALKPHFVTPMFDLVAPRYDDFTRVFSFGMDAHWKAELVRLVLQHSERCDSALDAACGTGDLALAVALARPNAAVTAIDASREMLAFARMRVEAATAQDSGVASRVSCQEGDLGALPAADASVDVVTAGYAFRNAAALAPAVAEAARVTRPGGVIAVLDFYRPAFGPWRLAFLSYLRAAGNVFGWWWHGEPVAYGYIAHSIQAHVSSDDFSELLERSGFDVLECRRFLLGGVAIHVARRRA